MRCVGIRDLKNRTTQLLHEEEVLLVQRHGKDVGVYVPLGEIENIPLEVRLRLFQKVTDEVACAARRRGISEQALVRRFEALKARKRRGH